MGLDITQTGATTFGPSTSTVQPQESNFTSLSFFLSQEYLPGLGSNTDLLSPPLPFTSFPPMATTLCLSWGWEEVGGE